MGFSEAGMLLDSASSTGVTAVLAIHGCGEPVVQPPPHVTLHVLRFDDWPALDDDDPIQAARIRMRMRWAADNGRTIVLPTRDHAADIIEFARTQSAAGGTLLCHCQAGISRSTAAALLCLATWTGPGHEMACVRRLLAIRPHALPHTDLVRFGDELLERDGALTAAARTIDPD